MDKTVYILEDRKIRVEWTILKGTSPVREDFHRALVKVFLIGNCEKYLLEATADRGTLMIDIPEGLEPGLYSLEAIWVKNAGHPGRHDRDLCRSMKQDLFAITEFEEEATNLPEGTVVLKAKSSTATYGYDGLSSYELAVLRGEWNGTEGEWLKHQRYVSVLDGRGDSEVDTMSQKSITEELVKHDTAIEDTNKEIDTAQTDIKNLNDEMTEVQDRLAYIPKESFLSSEPACDYHTEDNQDELTVSRAIKDRFGRIIDEHYVTRETVKDYTQEVVDGSKLEIQPGSVQPEDLSPAVQQMIESAAAQPGHITNLPDEEDLTVTEHNTLQFKDREYNPYNYSGMGKVYLRKHIVNGTNMLTQHMMNKPNTIYVIRYDYCLGGETIEVPEGCILKFEGGSLRNGTIVGNESSYIVSSENPIFSNLSVSGNWGNKNVFMDWFSDNTNNDFFSAENISNRIIFSNKEYVFYGNITPKAGTHIEGNGCTLKLYKTKETNQVLFGLRDDTSMENVNILCREDDDEWNRLDLSGRQNVTIRNCKIEGFRHISDRPNAWGIYMGRGTNNIRIEDCIFSNNSQADISIVETCTNIYIIGCKMRHLNVEPNSNIDPIRNLRIISCDIEKLSLLENSFTGVSIQSAILSSNHIGNLNLKGGCVKIDDSNVIDTISHPYYSSTYFYGTELTYNDEFLSNEILKSPHLLEIYHTAEVEGVWKQRYSSTSNAYRRYKENDITYLRLNPDMENDVSGVNFFVKVSPGEIYRFLCTTRAMYKDAVSWAANFGAIAFYKNSSLITEHRMIYHQGYHELEPALKTDWKTHTWYIQIPENCNEMRISLISTNYQVPNKSALDIAFTSLKRKVSYINKEICETKDYVTKKPELSPGGGPNEENSNSFYMKGMIVHLLNTPLGNFSGYLCAKSGNPGEWVGFDFIDSGLRKQGANNAKPTSKLTENNAGFEYFDTTNNKPIWWTGSHWVDATGSQV